MRNVAVVVVVVVFVVVETWVFLSSASTLPGLVARTESGGDGLPNS